MMMRVGGGGGGGAHAFMMMGGSGQPKKKPSIAMYRRLLRFVRPYRRNLALSAALLPGPLREAFGLSFGVPQRLFYRAVIVAIRALRPVLPEWITVVPQARRFERAMSERLKAA